MSSPKFTRRSVMRAMTAGLASSIAPIGLADLESTWLDVERRELELPNWDANGFRVAVISDVHVMTTRQRDLAFRACELALAEKPDLIALPGDFINFADETRYRYVREALAPLRRATCPVIATLGNHDYAAEPNPVRLVHTLQEISIRVLCNETQEVDGVTVVGIDDGLANKYRPDCISKDLHSKSLLAFLHEPDYVEEMPTFVSLQVSGHSHGGQICLPGGISFHTPKGARNYISGYYPSARIPLYVSRGVGTVGPQMRLFCRPEVSILTLKGG